MAQHYEAFINFPDNTDIIVDSGNRVVDSCIGKIAASIAKMIEGPTDPIPWIS